MKPLWFCIVSCHLLWFTFTKALFNVLLKKITKKKVVFKSTKKKGKAGSHSCLATAFMTVCMLLSALLVC